MKRNVSEFRLALAALTVVVLLLAALGSVPASAQKTWYVDDDNYPGPGTGTVDDPFCKIQDAIDTAQPGDTIIVAAGTYPERLVINREGLTLKGDGSYPMIQPTLDSTNKYDTVILVKANNITIMGLDISNADGVVDQGSSGHIEHHGIWDGSWTVGPAGLTVDDCIFHDIEHGVRSYGDRFTVTNSEFYRLGRTGVYASGYRASSPLVMSVKGNWFHDFIPRWKENHAIHVKYDGRVGEVSGNYISGMRIGIAYYYGGPKPGFGQIVFCHNTFDLDYNEDGGTQPMTMGVSLYGTGSNGDSIIIRDNIFANARWYAIYQEGANIEGSIRVDNNLLYNNYWYYWPEYQYPYQWSGGDERAHVGWTGGESGFTFANNIVGQDPLFAYADPGPEGQWALTCGSPAYKTASDGTNIGAWQGELTCAIKVNIDIKPGDDTNSINPRSMGSIPVAILSTDEFDASDLVNCDTLTFGRTGDENSLARRSGKHEAPHCSVEDVNNDGLPDLVCHFTTQETGFESGDTEGVLKGQIRDGTPIEGVDSVRIVPSNKPHAMTDELKVLVSPNPIRDVHTAHFHMMGTMAAEVEEIRVQIYDLSGRLVWEDTTPGSELEWHTEDLSGTYLANGVYLYKVQIRVDGSWISQELGKIVILR